MTLFMFSSFYTFFKRTLLKGTKFYINENYPRKIGYNRRKLQPIYAYAKQKKQYEKQMSFKGDPS